MKSFDSRKGRFRVLRRKTVFRGRVTQLDLLDIRTASGRSYEREIIRHNGAVVIIPRLKDGRFVLIRQLRVATGKEILEFPAGTFEKGETAKNCAQRELIEETGWRAGRLRRILEFFPTPGVSTERMILFTADRLERAKNPGPLDADEELEVIYLRPSQLEHLIRRGSVIDGKTILGYLYYKTFLPA